MTAGRPRTPTELHKARGTFRADRHNTDEPEAKQATAKLPRWAELAGEAEKCYRRLAPMLSSMRVLTEADVAALVQVARRYGEYMDAAEQVRDEGATYTSEGRDGRQIKAHPAVAIRDRAWADYQKGLIEFGLTPVSRSKITAMPEPEGTNPLAGMMGG